MSNRIIVIAGATASGKSALGISLAQQLGGQIVSADSMQIYRGLDIGTAKPTAQQLSIVPHHMIDIASPDQDFCVSDFVTMAQQCIDQIRMQSGIPIVVGGTGLYIRSLLYDYDFCTAPKNPSVREHWNDLLARHGAQYVYAHLCQIDPESATKISPNDTKRTIRAIEIFEVSGKRKSDHIPAQPKLKWPHILIGLDLPREILYRRIDARVDQMMADGLLDEVRGLVRYRQCNSMQAIGYKQLLAYLDGHVSLAEATESIKRASRNYAKRQLTLLRQIPSVEWVSAEKQSTLRDIVLQKVRNYGVI